MQSSLYETVRSVAEGKPKGGARLQALLERANKSNQLTLFIPWAAPPLGRTCLKRELQTFDWLNTVTAKLGSLHRGIYNFDASRQLC